MQQAPQRGETVPAANISCGRPSPVKVRARQKRFLPATQHNSTVSYIVRCKWTPPTHALCTSRPGTIWAQPMYHASCFVPASHRFSAVHIMRYIAGRRRSGLSLRTTSPHVLHVRHVLLRWSNAHLSPPQRTRYVLRCCRGSSSPLLHGRR